MVETADESCEGVRTKMSRTVHKYGTFLLLNVRALWMKMCVDYSGQGILVCTWCYDKNALSSLSVSRIRKHGCYRRLEILPWTKLIQYYTLL